MPDFWILICSFLNGNPFKSLGRTSGMTALLRSNLGAAFGWLWGDLLRHVAPLT